RTGWSTSSFSTTRTAAPRRSRACGTPASAVSSSGWDRAVCPTSSSSARCASSPRRSRPASAERTRGLRRARGLEHTDPTLLPEDRMKFDLLYELQMPKPHDDRSEYRCHHHALQQILLPHRPPSPP